VQEELLLVYPLPVYVVHGGEGVARLKQNAGTAHLFHFPQFLPAPLEGEAPPLRDCGGMVQLPGGGAPGAVLGDSLIPLVGACMRACVRVRACVRSHMRVCVHACMRALHEPAGCLRVCKGGRPHAADFVSAVPATLHAPQLLLQINRLQDIFSNVGCCVRCCWGQRSTAFLPRAAPMQQGVLTAAAACLPACVPPPSL